MHNCLIHDYKETYLLYLVLNIILSQEVIYEQNGFEPY